MNITATIEKLPIFLCDHKIKILIFRRNNMVTYKLTLAFTLLSRVPKFMKLQPISVLGFRDLKPTLRSD